MLPPPTRPITHCYWVSDRLLAGEYPRHKWDEAASVQKLRSLIAYGVRTFVDLTEPGELEPYESMARKIHGDLRFLRFPIRDVSVPRSTAHTVRILDAIDEAIEGEEGVVYVHCWGGVGRTGTIVGCWLARHRVAPDPLAHLEELWSECPKSRTRESPETDEQRAYIRGWSEPPRAEIDLRALSIGCLLGGAVGDALGAPIEFMSLDQIRSRYGPQGLTEMEEAYGRIGAITDDTQMTLFTAEGLLRARNRAADRGLCSPPHVMLGAYLRWLATQGYELPADQEGTEVESGWLITNCFLHAQRAPGKTCVSALRAAASEGRTQARNDSKGCGGVMRAAPAGLIGMSDAFTLGVESAWLTHGHPSGYLAAGALAHMIRRISQGDSLTESLGSTLQELSEREQASEVVHALQRARALSQQGDPSAEKLESLGLGWVAEEALGMSVYCALVAEDFRSALLLAVNHSGDSDSTGAITGNILGALWGPHVIPGEWLEVLEGREVIEAVAEDLARPFTGSFEEMDVERYPTW